MSEKDKVILDFWRKTHPKAPSKHWKEGMGVQFKAGGKLRGRILEVRTGSRATLLSSQGVNQPVKVSGIGRVLSIAVKTNDGRLHFGNPKDLKKIR